MVFQKGVSGNPKGTASDAKGYQPYGARAKYLLSIYDAGQILELLSDKKKFNKLPIRDAMMIKQMGEAIAGNDARLERESLLDRIEGKAHQAIEVTGQVSIVSLVLEASKQIEPVTIDQEANTKAIEHSLPMNATILPNTIQTIPDNQGNEFKQPSDKQE